MEKRTAMFYFAYGSNMNHAQMKSRCPASRFVKRVFLKGHRFVYDGYTVKRQGSVANIVPSESEIVRGGLFEVTERDRFSLDELEGYPRTYSRKEVEVLDEEGKAFRVWTYFRTGRPVGKPHPDYEKLVLDGARDCKLPEIYIDLYLRVKRL